MQALSSNEISAVRAAFPALQIPNQCIFLDNAGGSQVLKLVADRIHDYLLTSSVQLGATYSTSSLASTRVLEARKAVAELINATDDREVVMGGSTTGLMFQLIQAILPGIQAGDEIILTNTDHEANIGAWKRLQQAGAIIKIWQVNPQTLQLDLDDLEKLLSINTKWLAMTFASNVLGTINPVAEVARRVHAVGGRVCVDAVAYAPHRLVDVQASGADIVVFSFYKVFGPHYAVLWGKFELLLGLANLNHFFIAEDNLPYKLQPGNVNFELSYGCQGIADYLVDMGERFGGSGSRRQLMQYAFDKFEAHENYLAQRLLDFLNSKSGVRIIGMREVHEGDATRVPTISFVVENTQSETIVKHIDQFNIGIRFGDFYARHLIEALDLQQYGGVVRVSIAHYNTVEEIDLLISRLNTILPSA
ncbi:cysteine desulfurase-like protein [Undibacterium seohonense]|uniref:Cysteine desulfurase-like protein n=1 Tax=Undibacterium seohonense TaxID=1344950 RepID=A0ABR6X9E5_9BURK|nr:cysteine desulfurase-like protein [Undibacterium seohonense]MBC3809288.1 cysteine desulfurase-like protein [Undibacterium seohonense]